MLNCVVVVLGVGVRSWEFGVWEKCEYVDIAGEMEGREGKADCLEIGIGID
jgi:hypothetical protein